MNYLLDRKTKRSKPIKIVVCVVVVIILFYFRTGIFSGLSYLSATVFRPVLTSGNNVGGKIKSIGAYFSSKNSLYNENLNLKARIDRDTADRANYDSVIKENADLKEILGRKNEGTPLIIAAILEKPNQSPYDTIVIDIGSDSGLMVGKNVFALGSIPIGRVAEVYPRMSKVILFTNSGEKTEVIISSKPASTDVSQGGNVFAELIGRGGGNFEMVLPRDMILLKDDQVVLPGITPYVVGIVKTIISDEREAFQKALLVAPVNIQSLKFVEVEK